MTQSRRPSKRTIQLVRGALFIAAAGGLLLGMALQAGLGVGWDASAVGLGLGGFALLGLALLLHSLAFRVPIQESVLPGDVLGKGTKAAKQGHPKAAQLQGRVPFSAGKATTTRTRDPQAAKLFAQLESINRQMQRAAVDLGLGQLSQEGYTMIVQELKEKRGEVERAIARHQRGPKPGGAKGDHTKGTGQGRARA